MIRVPPDASVGLKSTLMELDQKIDSSVSRLNASINQLNTNLGLALQTLNSDLKTYINRSLPQDFTLNRPGTVKAPGSAIDATGNLIAEQFLREDGVWVYPPIKDVSNIGITTDPFKSFELEGHLYVLGQMLASGVQCGDLIQNNVFAAYVTSSIDQTATSGVSLNLTWDTISFNYGNIWSSASPTVFTFPYPGLVICGVHTRWAASATTGIRGCSLSQGVTSISAVQINTADGTTPIRTTATGLALVKANDTLTSNAFQTTGGNLNVTSAGPSSFWAIQVVRMA